MEWIVNAVIVLGAVAAVIVTLFDPQGGILLAIGLLIGGAIYIDHGQ